ncbi:uncharacterized protein LOC116259113 [Nymphaea colorata]|uniref:uncharacterized protein LOC116259113 n=1 Tax=Nymphaea colorata TaxID=210225 RepID=UPI00129EB01A|nr:uncharacterized protein LOC116259113 [Nymphaea colorata]
MAMAWPSDMQGRCLKHPDRRPSPGVCSVCLKERLVHLSHCKPSSYSSASLSTSYSHYSYSPSSSESSTRSTPPLPPASSWAPPHEEGEEHEPGPSSLMSKEGTRLSERAGRLWPLRRSRSAAYEVKRPVAAEPTKKTVGGGAGGGGLWSMLMMKGRKEAAEEKGKGKGKGKGRTWRFGQSKTVKDIAFLGVR